MTTTQDVKRIARRTGLTYREVVDIADDLGIQTQYRLGRLADRAILEIADRKEAALLIEHLQDQLDKE